MIEPTDMTHNIVNVRASGDKTPKLSLFHQLAQIEKSKYERRDNLEEIYACHHPKRDNPQRPTPRRTHFGKFPCQRTLFPYSPRCSLKRLLFRKPIGLQPLDRREQMRGQFLKIVRVESQRGAEILLLEANRFVQVKWVWVFHNFVSSL